MSSNLSEVPSEIEDGQSQAQPQRLQTKIEDFARQIEELSGSKAQTGPGRLDFALQSGEQVRCQIQFENQLLITVAMTRLEPDRMRELAPWLLNLNAFGKGAGGGWLAYDMAGSILLYHYRWGNFLAGSWVDFSAVMEAVMMLSQQLKQLILSDEWRKTIPTIS